MEEKLQLLRRPEVEKMVAAKCSTIYAKIKKLRFPKQYNMEELHVGK